MVNKFIYIPLTILILLAVSIQLINFQTPLGTDMTSSINANPNTENSLSLGNIFQISFTVVATVGFVSLFVGLIIIGVLMGLHVQILSSTINLSERSQCLLFNGLFYGGLWGLFSVFVTVGINNISLFSVPILGIVIYFIMTLFYVLGINSEINGT